MSTSGSWWNLEDGCPVPRTHESLIEATLYIAHMGKDYHVPRLLLAHLNTTIQALRNITFRLQSEKHRIPSFEAWYERERERLEGDPLLRRFRDARNTVVKKAGLEAKSTFKSGLFCGRRLKLAVGLDLPLMTASAAELERLRSSSFANMIFKSDRPAIGEQLGVERIWVAEELGEGEILSLCTSARNKLSEVVSSAHARCGSSFRSDPLLCDDEDRARFQVLLETDLDPSLRNRWGWDDAEDALRRWLKSEQ